ncbi:MAG TPA: hypothetical protein VGZ00_09325 [Candidatus Baltobacteraceae bacterium]|jgi:hypothetical protein|nr:hypothetical protein [Candidatus Baltobacteraceae bacterium]
METPGDIDSLLTSILEGARERPLKHDGRLSEQDRQFITRMIDAIENGSKGVFVVLNPDNSLDYLIANDTRLGAIAILSRMIQRTARRVEGDE